MKSLRSCSSDCLLQNKLTFTKLAHYSIWSWVTVIPGQSLFKKTAATLANIVNPNCSKNNSNNISHDGQEDENALSLRISSQHQKQWKRQLFLRNNWRHHAWRHHIWKCAGSKTCSALEQILLVIERNRMGKWAKIFGATSAEAALFGVFRRFFVVSGTFSRAVS